MGLNRQQLQAHQQHPPDRQIHMHQRLYMYLRQKAYLLNCRIIAPCPSARLPRPRLPVIMIMTSFKSGGDKTCNWSDNQSYDTKMGPAQGKSRAEGSPGSCNLQIGSMSSLGLVGFALLARGLRAGFIAFGPRHPRTCTATTARRGRSRPTSPTKRTGLLLMFFLLLIQP